MALLAIISSYITVKPFSAVEKGQIMNGVTSSIQFLSTVLFLISYTRSLRYLEKVKTTKKAKLIFSKILKLVLKVPYICRQPHYL